MQERDIVYAFIVFFFSPIRGPRNLLLRPSKYLSGCVNIMILYLKPLLTRGYLHDDPNRSYSHADLYSALYQTIKKRYKANKLQIIYFPFDL